MNQGPWERGVQMVELSSGGKFSVFKNLEGGPECVQRSDLVCHEPGLEKYGQGQVPEVCGGAIFCQVQSALIAITFPHQNKDKIGRRAFLCLAARGSRPQRYIGIDFKNNRKAFQ